jgi:hypothetical protein
LSEPDIREIEIGDAAFGIVDMVLRQIDSKKLGVREVKCVRDKVRTVTASEFKDAAGFGRGRKHSEHRRDRRQPIRMSLKKELARIRQFVV